MLIDTHAHLYSDPLWENITDIVGKAKAAGVSHVVMPNIDVESIEKMLSIAAQFSNCIPTMGLHPCSVDQESGTVLDLMEEHLSTGKYFGVGETGIDLYWDKTYVEEQRMSFARHLDWAISFDLPVIIHSRDSIDMCIEMVAEKQKGNLHGVFHCFTGDDVQAQKIKDLGFFIGIGGVVTYKNSPLPVVLKNNGWDNVVLETDSPYLPPVPHRGKPNESSYIVHVAEKLCEIFETNFDELASITSKNAAILFSKVSF